MVRKPREIGRGAIKEVAQLPQAHHGDSQQRLSTATLNRDSQPRLSAVTWRHTDFRPPLRRIHHEPIGKSVRTKPLS